MWAKLVRNAGSNVAGTLVALGVGFVTMPLVVHHLGAAAFGVWVLATGLVGHLGLLDAGLAPTLVKKSAELLARDDEAGGAALSETVSTIYALYAVLGGIGLLIVAGVAAGAGSLFQVHDADRATLQLVLLLVGLQAALGFPMSIWNGLLSGLEAFHVLNAIGVVTHVTRGVLTVLLVRSGYGLLALVVLGFVLAVGGWTASRWLVRRRLPALRVGFRHARRACLGDVGRFSGAMVVWAMAGAALHQLDRVLIGVMLPIQALTTWEVGARLTTYSRNVLHSWLGVVMPATSRLAAQGDRRRLRGLFLRGTRYLLTCYVLVAVGLVAFGWPFIRLWMGPEYASSFTILCVLLAGSLFQSQNVVAHVMLPGMGELRTFTRFMAVYPLVTVTCSVAGIRWGGLLGLALGLATSMLLMESVFVGIALRRFEVSPGRFLRRCHAPLARMLVVVCAWATATRLLVPIDGWTSFLASVVPTALVMLASAWSLALTAGERRLVAARAQARLPALRARAPVSGEAPCS